MFGTDTKFVVSGMIVLDPTGSRGDGGASNPLKGSFLCLRQCERGNGGRGTFLLYEDYTTNTSK